MHFLIPLLSECNDTDTPILRACLNRDQMLTLQGLQISCQRRSIHRDRFCQPRQRHLACEGDGDQEAKLRASQIVRLQVCIIVMGQHACHFADVKTQASTFYFRQGQCIQWWCFVFHAMSIYTYFPFVNRVPDGEEGSPGDGEQPLVVKRFRSPPGAVSSSVAHSILPVSMA
jgi:hypothetical protein